MTDDVTLPAPLVPAGVDLTDFPYMPLNIRRLLKSETWIEAADNPKVGHALMCLWCESWQQIPCGSLPNNEKMLAQFAMCAPRVWSKIREKALEGWILCSDGLLYHPVVSEKALETWEKKWNRPDKALGRSEHARKAAKARWNRDAPSNAQADKAHAASTHPASTEQASGMPGAVPGPIPEDMLKNALKGGEEKRTRKKDAPSGARDDAPGMLGALIAKPTPQLAADPTTELYRRGRDVLGANAGGMIKRLIEAKGGAIPLARAAVEQASTKASPREYIGGILKKQTTADNESAQAFHDWASGRDGFG